MVDLRFSQPRTAWKRQGVHALHQATRCERLWSVARADSPIRVAAAQDGPHRDRGPAGQVRGDRVLPAVTQTSGALPAGGRGPRRATARKRRYQASRRGARVAVAAEADLQPPIAVARRRRLARGGQWEARTRSRARRGGRRQAGEAARLHAVSRDLRTARRVSRHDLRATGTRAPRRDAREGAKRSGAQVPGRRRCAVLRPVAQGRRDGVEPHCGVPCRALRPLVEPSR